MLSVENSCEVDDLIREVMKHSNKSWEAVEHAFFDVGIYPQSTKTYIVRDSLGTGIKWLDVALTTVMVEANIKDVYITAAI